MPHELGVMVHACNPSALELLEVGESEGQGHPWLHTEFEGYPGLMRHRLKKKEKINVPDESESVEGVCCIF